MIFFPKDMICLYLCVECVCVCSCAPTATHKYAQVWAFVQGCRESLRERYFSVFLSSSTFSWLSINQLFPTPISPNGPSFGPKLLWNSLLLPPSLSVFLFQSTLRRPWKWWALRTNQSPLPSGRAVEGYPLKAVCAQQAVKVMLHNWRSKGTGSNPAHRTAYWSPSHLLSLLTKQWFGETEISCH